MATYLPVAEDTFKRDMSETGEKIPFLIGVAGGRASGKTTVCAQLIETLGQNEMTSVEKQVVSLSQDSFYRELTPQEIAKAEKGAFNFDHPSVFDHHLMETVIKVSSYIMKSVTLPLSQSILCGRTTKVPVYDFKTHTRVPGQFSTIYPSDVVLVEGTLVFYFSRIREMFDLKLFVDTDPDTRLAR